MEALNMILAMKFEMALTLILFFLLFLKIEGSRSNIAILRVTNFLLVVNLALGFFGNDTQEVFGGMFRTSPLLAIDLIHRL